MNITLKRNGATKGVIYWNSSDGTVNGLPSLTEPIIRAAADGLQYGSISGTPIPTSYPVQKPLFDMGEFAVLLNHLRYDLEGDMLTAFNQYRKQLGRRPVKFAMQDLRINLKKVVN